MRWTRNCATSVVAEEVEGVGAVCSSVMMWSEITWGMIERQRRACGKYALAEHNEVSARKQNAGHNTVACAGTENIGLP